MASAGSTFPSPGAAPDRATPLNTEVPSIASLENYFIEHSQETNTREVTVIEEAAYQKIIYPTHRGRCLLANYYKDKYGIEIIIPPQFSDLRTFIDYYQQQPTPVKIGFIVNTTKSGTGHAIPVVYEKTSTTESVISFDSLGPGGIIGYAIDEINELINKGRAETEKIEIYANDTLCPDLVGSMRQNDDYSCVTDAVVVLKDVLREKDITQLVQHTTLPKKQLFAASCPDFDKYIPFLLPAKWSKTARPDYLGKYGTNADFDVPIHTRRIKSADAKMLAETKETLRQFHKRYSAPITLHTYTKIGRERGPLANSRKMERYLYLKIEGYKNIGRVIQQLNKYSQPELATIISSREGKHILSPPEVTASHKPAEVKLILPCNLATPTAAQALPAEAKPPSSNPPTAELGRPPDHSIPTVTQTSPAGALPSDHSPNAEVRAPSDPPTSPARQKSSAGTSASDNPPTAEAEVRRPDLAPTIITPTLDPLPPLSTSRSSFFFPSAMGLVGAVSILGLIGKAATDEKSTAVFAKMCSFLPIEGWILLLVFIAAIALSRNLYKNLERASVPAQLTP